VTPGFKRFILWDYPRGGWQYDVMCALIVLFIFVAPRQWFRDQPRIPQAAQIGESVFWIDTELYNSFPEPERLQQLGKVVTGGSGKKQELIRIEPILDSEKELKGYMAFAKP
jgi:hypothetical protein